jgi:hypothetical protein
MLASDPRGRAPLQLRCGAILVSVDPLKNLEGCMSEETREVVPLESSVPALPKVEELAAKIIEVMDMIAERMELETPHPSTSSRVRGARTISREFVVALIAVVESMPEFQKFNTFDPAEAREVLQGMDAYKQVSERTSRLLASMNYTIEARWAKIAADATLTFSLASIQAKDPGQAEVAAAVENLRKLLGRKGKGTGKKKKE